MKSGTAEIDQTPDWADLHLREYIRNPGHFGKGANLVLSAMIKTKTPDGTYNHEGTDQELRPTVMNAIQETFQEKFDSERGFPNNRFFGLLDDMIDAAPEFLSVIKPEWIQLATLHAFNMRVESTVHGREDLPAKYSNKLKAAVSKKPELMSGIVNGVKDVLENAQKDDTDFEELYYATDKIVRLYGDIPEVLAVLDPAVVRNNMLPKARVNNNLNAFRGDYITSTISLLSLIEKQPSLKPAINPDDIKQAVAFCFYNRSINDAETIYDLVKDIPDLEAAFMGEYAAVKARVHEPHVKQPTYYIEEGQDIKPDAKIYYGDFVQNPAFDPDFLSEYDDVIHITRASNTGMGNNIVLAFNHAASGNDATEPQMVIYAGIDKFESFKEFQASDFSDETKNKITGVLAQLERRADLPDIATAWRVSPEESKEKLAVSAKAQLDKAFMPV